MIQVGSDFSGVGAFDQALRRLNIDYKTAFACDMDLYARETYMANYGEPVYYPFDVYDREIPKQSLDIYMTSPPCQAFSLAGKRQGEDDKRGVLFYNSHEFIVKNKPRYFIFENVKGLLSDAKGRTFQIWLDMLGGKTVNGNPVIFPREDATPYHIYYKVLNAKNYGVPQNRERVFIIGIRDDADNNFHWPKKQHLTKRLKDVLETDVDQKYYLSDKMINYLHQRSDNFNNGKVNYKDENDTASCITKSSSSIDISDNIIKVGNTNPSGNGMNGNVFDADGISPTLSTNKGEGIKVIKHERTTEAKIKRSKSLKENGKDTGSFADRQMIAVDQDYSDTILANANPKKEGLVMIGAFRGRNPENTNDRTTGAPMQQTLEINKNGTSNTITSVQKDNVVCTPIISNYRSDNPINSDNKVFSTLRANAGGPLGGVGIYHKYKIRRLTPRECFRLMDFPDTFKMPCSNSQMYKQAGNSIVVAVLAGVISKLNL